MLGRGLGAADGDRERASAQRDPLRAAGGREDDAGADRGGGRRGRLRGGVGGQRRQGRDPGGDRAGAGAAAGSGRPTILFLDEIHRFNKAQQDALLPAVEEGLLTLIGATTENPYFEVNSALLSRCQIYELQPLEPEQVEELLRRALADPERGIAGPARRSRTRRWRCWPTAQRRRRPGRALGAGAGGRAGRRRAGRRRGGRGRAAAQGDRLRPPGRPPLRLRLRLDQGDPRLRRRRLALLPGGDAGGRRGPALHRPPDGHPRLRGRRQRRPAGAAGRRRRRPRRRPRRPARVRAQPRPGGRLPRPRPEVERLLQGASAPPAPRSAPTAPRRRPTTCATPTTRAPPSSGRGEGYRYAHDEPDGVSDQPLLPAGLEDAASTRPTDRGFEAELGERLERLRKSFRQALRPGATSQHAVGFQGRLSKLEPGRADTPGRRPGLGASGRT